MTAKKKEFADVSKKRGFYLSIGYIVSLTLVIILFLWPFQNDSNAKFEVDPTDFEKTLVIPLTVQNDEIEPPPPEETVPEIKEKPNDDLIEDVKVDLNTEFGDDTKVESPITIEPPVEFIPAPPFYLIPEEDANYPGGNTGILKYFQNNIVYPQDAIHVGISGKVYLQFIINENGEVEQIVLKKGIGGGCDEEAIRVLKKMKWSPGKQGGRAVKVQKVLPVNFILG